MKKMTNLKKEPVFFCKLCFRGSLSQTSFFHTNGTDESLFNAKTQRCRAQVLEFRTSTAGWSRLKLTGQSGQRALMVALMMISFVWKKNPNLETKNVKFQFYLFGDMIIIVTWDFSMKPNSVYKLLFRHDNLRCCIFYILCFSTFSELHLVNILGYPLMLKRV